MIGYESPYANVNLEQTIAWVSEGTHSDMNSGLIGDAVANFGSCWMIGYPVLFGILMLFMNVIVGKVDEALTLCGAFYVAFYLVSSFMTTLLFTKGVLTLLILLYCSGNERNEIDNTQ
ncbi:hypothetical protein FZ041_06070 [Selenomonas caprae]|uniref:Uncharacterized protein n=1 Tax=Selenomonas caprae TaxID=2606905 RepID=A0A5D6WQA4_9FIRM|nr:hypothetical protein [Selenomonas caprae]TYZ29108.1 hypothetical protein FZ041_06070 [Selenomonas caprae]